MIKQKDEMKRERVLKGQLSWGYSDGRALLGPSMECAGRVVCRIRGGITNVGRNCLGKEGKLN
jgi:hypothetical protein